MADCWLTSVSQSPSYDAYFAPIQKETVTWVHGLCMATKHIHCNTIKCVLVHRLRFANICIEMKLTRTFSSWTSRLPHVMIIPLS